MISKGHKVLLAIYGLCAAFLCIFVPWMFNTEKVKWSRDYSFIWIPPADYHVLDIDRFLVELIGLTILFAVIYLLTKKQ